MAKKKTERFPVVPLTWRNVVKRSEMEPVTHKDMVLEAHIVNCGGVPGTIISQPYQDVDGKVRYLLFDRDTQKWDKRHPKVAATHRDPKVDVVVLSCCA